MYTQLKLKARLKRDEELEKFLRNHIDYADWIGRSPIHSHSTYFKEDEVPKLDVFQYHTLIESIWNIKDYDNDIEKFLERIKPFVLDWEWHIWYEEYNKPQQLLIMNWEEPKIERTNAKFDL
jgi:hypothetical protein